MKYINQLQLAGPIRLMAPSLLLIVILFTSCETTRVITASVPEVQIDKGRVAILQTNLRYISIEDDETLTPATYQADQTQEFLYKQLQQVVFRKGLQNLEESKIEIAVLPPSEQLVLPKLSQESIQIMQKWAKPFGFPYVLALSGIVKVGQAGSWDPFSGAISSNNSYTRIKGVLINTELGTILWRNEVQLRAIPMADKKDLIESIQALFQNLKTVNHEKATD